MTNETNPYDAKVLNDPDAEPSAVKSGWLHLVAYVVMLLAPFFSFAVFVFCCVALPFETGRQFWRILLYMCAAVALGILSVRALKRLDRKQPHGLSLTAVALVGYYAIFGGGWTLAFELLMRWTGS